MKYLKWSLMGLSALALGFMVTLKPGLFAGITAVLVITVIIVFLVMWRMRHTTEEKPGEKPDEKKPEKKTSWGGWVVTGAVVALLAMIIAYNLLAPKAPVVAQQQHWQLCWEKIPGATMATDTLQKRMPAIIQKAGNSLIIFYRYDGGEGKMEAISTDGVSFDGQWKDGVGWGRFHLRFASSNSAVGWVDDKGKKAINLWLIAKTT